MKIIYIELVCCTGNPFRTYELDCVRNVRRCILLEPAKLILTVISEETRLTSNAF